MKFSLRSKLLVSYTVVIFLSLVTFGGYILWFFHNSNINSLTETLVNHAYAAGQIYKEQKAIGKLEQLDADIKMITNNKNLRITVIEPTGVVIADSWERPADMENHRERPEIQAALEGKESSVTRFSTTLNENVLYAAVPIRNEFGQVIGVVRTSETLRFIELGFRQIIYVLIGAMLLTLLISALISNRMAKHYTKPIEKITSTATEIASGQLNKKVQIRTGDELEVIAYSLNRLTANLEEKINEVRAETKKLELILKNMDNGVILLDKFGRIQMVNQQVLEMFNVSDDILGRHSMTIIGNSQFETVFKHTVNELSTNKFILRHSTRVVQRSFQTFLSPILSSDNEVISVLAVFHDITELEEIHNRESLFIANVSHELATPLTSIKGVAETLIEGALYEPAKAENYIKIIYEEAYRMEKMVVNLLDIVRLTSDDYVKNIQKKSVCLNEVIKASVQEVINKPSGKEMDIKIIGDSDITIIGSFEWLKKMISHLIDNAVKYTPEQGDITIECYKDENYAVIRVSDTGLGIPPGELEFIFDRFYREISARTRTTGGTGLGLSIVKYIVDLHNGVITVGSILNEGTVFTIKLPFN